MQKQNFENSPMPAVSKTTPNGANSSEALNGRSTASSCDSVHYFWRTVIILKAEISLCDVFSTWMLVICCKITSIKPSLFKFIMK
jgi:hypothetical protein